MEVSWAQVGLLFIASLVAGTVDAIAGGGGLITLPALLATGLPVHEVLGTNKGQSVFGSFSALVRFWRGGLVDGRQAWFSFPLGLLGSLAGAALVLLIRPEVLRPLVLALLVAVAIFLTFRRPVAGTEGVEVTPARRAALAGAALLIGAYDGFFGPGTGTFLIVAFVVLGGASMARASAGAKVVNFASNLAAVALFASRGLVVWALALPMALGQLCGGWLGAHLAVRRGDALVRRVVLVVVLVLCVRLGYDVYLSWKGAAP